MRVLVWQELFWPHLGGIEVLTAKLLPALRARDYEFIVVTRQDHPDLVKKDRYQGIPVYRFPFWTASTDVNQLMAIRQQVAHLKRTFAPDLVHISSAGPSVFFHHHTIHAHRAPVLVTLHTTLSSDNVMTRQQAFEPDKLLGRTLRAASWVNGCAPAVLAPARQLIPEITSRSSVIHNGVDVPSVMPEPLPVDEPRLLCLGRLHPQKGLDVALSAFALVIDRFPKMRLVIAGDGPLRSALEQQAVRLGIRHNVDFVGPVSPERVPTLLNTATAVVMPSRGEGLPLVSLEAALMERPVVATRVSGLTDVIVHHQTGLLVAPEDSDALAAAIGFLLTHPQKAARMGQAARRHVQQVFSWNGCVDAYDALYHKLITEFAAESRVAPTECAS